VTADTTAAATPAAATLPADAERWGLVCAKDWDAHGPAAWVVPYRDSRTAGRSAGAQNKYVRRAGLPDDRLILVVRGRYDTAKVRWQVAYDPRNGGAS
jgi:hypothetical protein